MDMALFYEGFSTGFAMASLALGGNLLVRWVLGIFRGVTVEN